MSSSQQYTLNLHDFFFSIIFFQLWFFRNIQELLKLEELRGHKLGPVNVKDIKKYKKKSVDQLIYL